MTRLTRVEKARKSPGKCEKCSCGIKIGQPYNWWKFRFGAKRVRCDKPECQPRRSELTQSEFYGNLFDAEESFQEVVASARKAVDVTMAIEATREAAERLREIGQECSDKLSNMPDGLQQGDTGQLLQERADNCEDRADELESAADSAETNWTERTGEDNDEEEKDHQEICDEVLDELESECDFSID